MTLSVDAFALQAFVISLALLGLKAILVAVRSVAIRKHGDQAWSASPEDDATVYKGKEVVNGPPHDELKRWQNIHRNDIENLIPFTAIGLATVLTVPEGTLAMVAGYLFYFFAGMRYVHTICYAAKLQPFRTLSWVLGAMIPLVALSGIALYGAFVG